jgi:hypothetical protein
MVWGSVWIDSTGRTKRSPLVIMEIDPNADRNKYTARSYIDVLAVGLLPTYRTREGFMQDNARIHKARLTMSLFEENDVRLVDFSTYSPDLNPIKHIWWALKEN